MMVLAGARRFPESRRRSVVLPAPFAPIRRVRLPGGRERETFLRPGWGVFGKVYVRLLTSIAGEEMGESVVVPLVGAVEGDMVDGGEDGWTVKIVRSAL